MDKANMLNCHFQQAFVEKIQFDKTSEEFRLQCRMEVRYPEMKDTNITLGGIMKLLKQLNPYKA
jgi:hypothetical protein